MLKTCEEYVLEKLEKAEQDVAALQTLQKQYLEILNFMNKIVKIDRKGYFYFTEVGDKPIPVENGTRDVMIQLFGDQDAKEDFDQRQQKETTAKVEK